MKLCNGLTPDAFLAGVIWTDGSGIAACGRADVHKAHAFTGRDRCRAPLPCGIRDRQWARHVCRLASDHADVDSPCLCAVCDSKGGEA